jgi:hypothetical protein
MLTTELEQTLHRALAEANSRGHGYATLEHLLLALCDDRDAAAVLRACDVDPARLRRDLIGYFDLQLSHLKTDDAADAKPTAGFQRTLQRAAIHVQSAGRDEVSGANLLVALFSERESNAVHFLHEQDMSRLDAANYISHGISKPTTSFLIADDRFAAADRALHVAAKHQRAGSSARALAGARLAFAVFYGRSATSPARPRRQTPMYQFWWVCSAPAGSFRSRCRIYSPGWPPTWSFRPDQFRAAATSRRRSSPPLMSPPAWSR